MTIEVELARIEALVLDHEASWHSMEGPDGNGFDRELDIVMGSIAERGTWRTVSVSRNDLRVLFMAAGIVLMEFQYRRMQQGHRGH